MCSLSKPNHESTKIREDHEKEFVMQPLLRVLRGPSCFRGCICTSQSAAVSTIGDGRLIILCRSAPAGTIGYTESYCTTTQKKIAIESSLYLRDSRLHY